MPSARRRQHLGRGANPDPVTAPKCRGARRQLRCDGQPAFAQGGHAGSGAQVEQPGQTAAAGQRDRANSRSFSDSPARGALGLDSSFITPCEPVGQCV